MLVQALIRFLGLGVTGKQGDGGGAWAYHGEKTWEVPAWGRGHDKKWTRKPEEGDPKQVKHK